MPFWFMCRTQTSGRPALLGVGALLLLAGCASIAPPSGSQDRAADTAERALRAEVARWHGTPHRWGGTDQRGVDCSAFVMALYRDVFDVGVPRTTARQVQAGTGVRQHALRVGDLVAFRPTRKTRHVGVYLGGGEFAHASSSAGVTVSSLDEPYWQRVYWRARRLLPPRTPATAPTHTTTSGRPQAPRSSNQVPSSW